MRTVDPEQHARRRAQILDAAAAEFAEHGVAGSSTAKICRRAGIGSGTLFHYFPTKRDIVRAMFAADLPGNERARRDALADPDPVAGVFRLLDRLVGDLANPLTPGLVAVMVLQANDDPEFAAMVGADDEATRGALHALLTRVAAGGRRLPFEPERTARWIQTMVDGSYLIAGDDGFDPVCQAAELRVLVGWLTGAGESGSSAARPADDAHRPAEPAGREDPPPRSAARGTKGATR